MAKHNSKRRNDLRVVSAVASGIPFDIATATEIDAPASEPLVQELAAERLRVMSNYAYYDDDGLFRAWPEGAVVTDHDEIELLTARGAPVEVIQN